MNPKEYYKNDVFAFLDGNALCIVKWDFINLQESPAMFITLTKEQIEEFKKLLTTKNKIIPVGVKFDKNGKELKE